MSKLDEYPLKQMLTAYGLLNKDGRPAVAASWAAMIRTAQMGLCESLNRSAASRAVVCNHRNSVSSNRHETKAHSGKSMRLNQRSFGSSMLPPDRIVHNAKQEFDSTTGTAS